MGIEVQDKAQELLSKAQWWRLPKAIALLQETVEGIARANNLPSDTGLRILTEEYGIAAWNKDELEVISTTSGWELLQWLETRIREAAGVDGGLSGGGSDDSDDQPETEAEAETNEAPAKEQPKQPPAQQQQQPAANDYAFAVTIHLLQHDGTPTDFQIVGPVMRVCLNRANEVKKYLLEKANYTIPTIAQAGAGSSSQNSAGSNLPNGHSGATTARCTQIKVGKSYNGSKPQLKFSVEGYQNDLTYTQSPLLKILAGAKKANGQPFIEGDMVDGRQFGGEWIVEIVQSSKDGKTYNNIAAVRNA